MFIRQFNPAFPVGVVDSPFVTNYSPITPMMRPTVPIIFFIDRKFTIRSQYFGNDPFFEAQDPGKAIRAEIDKLLTAESSPRPPVRRRKK